MRCILQFQNMKRKKKQTPTMNILKVEKVKGMYFLFYENGPYFAQFSVFYLVCYFLLYISTSCQFYLQEQFIEKHP